MTPPPPVLRLLDQPHLHQKGQRLDLPPNLPGHLLACLGMQGDWVSRERLATLFWPDATAADGQHHLRITLHRAKQQLAAWGVADSLQAARQRLRLDLACDVLLFRAAIGRADWAAAVALHRAPLLAAGAPRGFEALDEWLQLQRDALLTAWRNAALREAARLEADGDAAAAAALLQAQLQHDLLAEDAVQALLRVAAAAGQRSTALDTFERFARHAQRELGLQPLPGTVALAQALRQADSGAAPARSPASAPAPPTRQPATLSAPPLTGRQAELARLRGAAPGLLLVCGEPGIGKSRLLAEAFAAPAALWLQCRDGLQSAPLLPVLRALDGQMQRVRALLPGCAERRDLARLLPALADGELPAPADDAVPRALSALADLLPQLAPVLVVDDLQWADATTLQLLRECFARTCANSLADSPAATAGLRLCATLRPAEAPAAVQDWIDGLDAAGHLQRFDLSPLSAGAVAELLQRLAGSGAPRFAAWLHSRSGGNPFFALETLRALFDSGQLQARPTGWASDLDTLSADYHELQVPARVAALVRRRVDALPEAARRALGIAAIAGDARHLEPLAQVAGLSPWAMAEALAAAQAAGLLHGREFAHDLVREALERGTPEPLRAVLHAGIARHCAALLPPHRLAAHWWAAGDVVAAIDATQTAAAADRRQGLHGLAEERLLAARHRAGDAEQRARLDADRARTALEGNRLEAALAAANEALGGLPAPPVRLKALAVLADVALLQGRLDEAGRLQSLAAEIDADAPEVVSLACKLAYHAGRFDDAVALVAPQVARLRRQAPGLELVNMLTSLAAAHDGAGRSALALPWHEEALALARQLGARYVEVEVALNLIYALPELGRHDDAMAVGEAALALGDYDATPFLQNNLAWLYLDRGRTAEARALYERLADGAEPTLRCYARAKLVQIHAQQGDAAACRAAIDTAFAGLPQTQIYSAHAVVLVAVLQHGSPADALRVPPWLRSEPLEPSMQQRLDDALARHGLATA